MRELRVPVRIKAHALETDPCFDSLRLALRPGESIKARFEGTGAPCHRTDTCQILLIERAPVDTDVIDGADKSVAENHPWQAYCAKLAYCQCSIGVVCNDADGVP